MEKNNETTGNSNPNLFRQPKPQQNNAYKKSSNYKNWNPGKYTKPKVDGDQRSELGSQDQTQKSSALNPALNVEQKFKASEGFIPYANRLKKHFDDFHQKKSHFEQDQQYIQQMRLQNKFTGSENHSYNYHSSPGGVDSLGTVEISELRTEADVKPNSLSLLDSTNDSTKVPVIKSSNDKASRGVISYFDNPESDPEYDSDSSAASGDLSKMAMMTAADFNRDRYARYEIHESEMKDYVRTITYKNCIEYCSEQYMKNKVVLVIRCGIGLLPMFCIRSGHAKRVVALEQSACIEYARRVIKDNMYSHNITLIQSSVHDLKQLPHGLSQVDVILSDFLGDCVLSQGNEMEEVIEARDRFLKPNGLMIPMFITLYAQLSEQRRAYENRRDRKYSKKNNNNKTFDSDVVTKMEDESDGCDTDSSTDSTWCSWWSDVYGFDMRSKPEFLKTSESGVSSDFNKDWFVMTEPIISFFDPYKVVSTACIIKEFDMYKCTISEARYVQCKDLKLKCSTPYTSARGGDYAQMLELFMVVDFPNGQILKEGEEPQPIGFSTSSFSPNTRYAQTGLLLRDQLIIKEGDEFFINEFHIWRGPQENTENKSLEGIVVGNTLKITTCDENLKIRLRYTFVNKYNKAIDRRCAYIITKKLF